MKAKYLPSIVLLFALLTGAQVRAQVKAPSPVEARANDVMKFICAPPSNYENHFSKEFLAHVRPADLTAVFTQYCSTLGTPVRVEPATLESTTKGTFNLLYAKEVRVPMQIEVDAAAPHLIIHLLLRDPVSTSASEHEITFAGVGGLNLQGTLRLPVGVKGKVPGVLLLPGSGPTDRNGNQPPSFITDLLQQIANRLAKEGYASLRFDKRASRTYAKSFPSDVAAMNDFLSWDSFIGDAKAALILLQTQPEVDAKRVVVAGHSEGATFAIQLGHDLQGTTNAPAGLILMGSPGRTGGAIISEQVSNNLKRSGLTPEQTRPYSDYVALAISQVEKDGTIPPNPPMGLGALFPTSVAKLLRVELAFDPSTVLPVYTGPVLVVQGEKDIQISATRDTPLIETALRERRLGAYEMFIVPSASHNLKQVSDENKEPGLIGPVVPEALDKIASWMKKNFPN
jgi:pimeloyl-ACP methyl ester carboxylesterase